MIGDFVSGPGIAVARRALWRPVAVAVTAGLLAGGIDVGTLAQQAPDRCTTGQLAVTVPGVHVWGVAGFVRAWPAARREPAVRDVVASRIPDVPISTVVQLNGLAGPMGVVPARSGGVFCLRLPGNARVAPAALVLAGPARAGDVVLARAAYRAGFRGVGLVTAVAVALAESGGDPAAVCYNTGRGCSGTRTAATTSVDRGVWQINDRAHPEVSAACAVDVACAARAAYAISEGGRSWGAWVTWRHGAHLEGGRWARALAAAAVVG